MRNCLPVLLCLPLAAAAWFGGFAGAGEAVGVGVGGNGAAVAPVAATSGGFETTPLHFAAPRQATNPERGKGSPYSFSSILSVLFYVFLICGLFTAILWLAKRHLPGHRQMFSHPGVEVLGRTHLDPKRYVALLRIGKRVVVVGVSPDEMVSLSEISQEAEVTSLMEVARPKTDSGLNIFQKLFQRHVVEAETNRTLAEAEHKANALRDETAELRRRFASGGDGGEPDAAVRLDRLG